jgi:hypothetical protein
MEVNQFNRDTSLSLIDMLRRYRRTDQFTRPDGRSSDLNDFAFFFKTPTDGIPSRVDGICGNAVCTWHLLLDSGEFEETQDTETIWHSEEGEDIPGDTIIRVHLICDKLVADPYTSDEVIKFRSSTAIAGRKFNARGLQGRYGNLEITDPHNLWNNVTPGCIGTAYRNNAGLYEVHTSSLPANEIMVILQETLRSSMATSEAVVATSYYLRSTYPNVMRPPEIGACSGFCTYTWNRSTESWALTSSCASGCTCAPAPSGEPANANDEIRQFPCYTTDEQRIEFTNPWKLDGMCSSKAILRRVTNGQWGDSAGITNWSGTINGSATEARWEIVQVAKRKARWIQFPYKVDEPPVLQDFWDGDDPQDCDATAVCPDCSDDIQVEYPIGEPCEDDIVIARYNPERDTYIALDTNASMLGMPVIRNFVDNITNHSCGLTMGRTQVQVFMVKDEEGECSAASVPTDVQLGEEQQVILALSSDSCGVINYSFTTMRVFMCDYEVEVDDFAINFDGVQFVTAAEFGPPSCGGNATYTWNPDTDQWELTTPCANGCTSEPPPVVTPFPTSVYTETMPCSAPVNGQCGLNLQLGTICADTGSGAPSPTVVHVPLPLEPVTLVYDVIDNTAELSIYKKTVYVCNWEAANDGAPIPIGPCEPGGSSGGA